jgi:hypothetical protein
MTFNFSKNKKALAIIGASFFIAIIILVVWTFDFYPVAIVDNQPIMAYFFNKSLDVAYRYFGASDLKSQSEIKKAVFEGLIDEVSINTQLLKSMSPQEMEQKINSQMDEILNDTKVQNSLASLSITQQEARNYFLKPAIESQLLNAQLVLEGKNLLSWLLEQRKNLKVLILMPHAHWTGQAVTFD